MASAFKINPEFKDEVIGFKNSGTPLGQRSEEDLRDLAIKARTSNPSLARLFLEMPEIDDLKKMKGDAFLAKTPASKPAHAAGGEIK